MSAPSVRFHAPLASVALAFTELTKMLPVSWVTEKRIDSRARAFAAVSDSRAAGSGGGVGVGVGSEAAPAAGWAAAGSGEVFGVSEPPQASPTTSSAIAVITAMVGKNRRIAATKRRGWRITYPPGSSVIAASAGIQGTNCPLV